MLHRLSRVDDRNPAVLCTLYSVDRRQAVNLVSAPTHVPNCPPTTLRSALLYVVRVRLVISNGANSVKDIEKGERHALLSFSESNDIKREFVFLLFFPGFKQKEKVLVEFQTSYFSLSRVWLTHHTDECLVSIFRKYNKTP